MIHSMAKKKKKKSGIILCRSDKRRMREKEGSDPLMVSHRWGRSCWHVGRRVSWIKS
jgi:hypothetical protein